MMIYQILLKTKGDYMLVITRRKGETFCFYPRGKEEEKEAIVEVLLCRIQGDQIRLGISAPANIAVHRKEIYERILLEKQTY